MADVTISELAGVVGVSVTNCCRRSRKPGYPTPRPMS